MAFDARDSGAGGSLAIAGSLEEPLAVAQTPAFLGRRMVALAALASFLASGVTFGAFGNFVGPIAEAFWRPAFDDRPRRSPSRSSRWASRRPSSGAGSTGGGRVR